MPGKKVMYKKHKTANGMPQKKMKGGMPKMHKGGMTKKKGGMPKMHSKKKK